MNFAIAEGWCNEPPMLFITHSTNRNINKQVRESLVGTVITFDARLDDDETKPMVATIGRVNRIFATTNVVVFTVDILPEFFVEKVSKVLTLSIPEDNEFYEIFDLPVRQYRMEGFARVWIAAHQQCLDAQ